MKLEPKQGVVERIRNIAWFRAVGEPVSLSIDMPYELITSWKQAEEAYMSESAEYAAYEARNALSMHLHSNHKALFQQWNGISRGAKVHLASSFAKLEEIRHEKGLAKIFDDSVNWHILNAVMESAYQDCCDPPIFFLKLLDIYEAGHFPCGWKGTWPEGHLIVF